MEPSSLALLEPLAGGSSAYLIRSLEGRGVKRLRDVANLWDTSTEFASFTEGILSPETSHHLYELAETAAQGLAEARARRRVNRPTETARAAQG